MVLCVRQSCGKADTVTLPSHSPNPSGFITRQFHFPTVLPTSSALQDTSLCVLHQPGGGWGVHFKLGAPRKVSEDKQDKLSKSEAKPVLLGIALICICNPSSGRGTNKIQFSLLFRRVQSQRLKSPPNVLSEL